MLASYLLCYKLALYLWLTLLCYQVILSRKWRKGEADAEYRYWFKNFCYFLVTKSSKHLSFTIFTAIAVKKIKSKETWEGLKEKKGGLDFVALCKQSHTCVTGLVLFLKRRDAKFNLCYVHTSNFRSHIHTY